MSTSPSPVYPHKLRRLFWPFLALAEACREVIGTVAGDFRDGEKRYTIPRFTFLGPTTNVPQMRVGCFALLHGDEPAGAFALLKMLEMFAKQPELAAGYDLVCYPVCNPTGYEDETRHNRAGCDLNRLFWQSSSQPEIRILEQELETQAFDGIVALHTDDTSAGLYGYAHGRELNQDLLVPALRASERIIPCDHGPMIDGFSARAGVIDDCFEGVLRPSPSRHPRPFEIIFETPGRSAVELQADAAQVGLQTILSHYRSFIAYAPNL